MVGLAKPIDDVGLARRGVLVRHWTTVALLGILTLHLILGAAFAIQTPKWQAPDEPAHYNYVRSIAEGNGLPVLQPGDWDNSYLERIKAAGFPDDMPVDTIRYESHQPPLYYLLEAPVYWLFDQASLETRVLAMRLVSVALATLLLVVVFAIVRTVLPAHPAMGLIVTAIVGLLPQHLAMSSAIENDILAELVLAAIVLALFRLNGRRQTLALGIGIGLALLTKTTIYFVVAVVAIAILLPAIREHALPRALRRLGAIAGIAAVLSGWWFVRNMIVYGWLDPFGWQRHDAIVVGQQRTVYELSTLYSLTVTTFRSFWMQLGWMGVPAADWVYHVLLGLTLAAIIGALLCYRRCWPKAAPETRSRLLLLGLIGVFAIVQLGLYNLKFFQAQGRYLFPGLIAFALVLAIGWRELIRPRRSSVALLAVLALMVGLDLYALGRLVPHLYPRPAIASALAIDAAVAATQPSLEATSSPAEATASPSSQSVVENGTPSPIEAAVIAPTPISTSMPEALETVVAETTPATVDTSSSVPEPTTVASESSPVIAVSDTPEQEDPAMQKTVDVWQQDLSELARADLTGLTVRSDAVALAEQPDQGGTLVSPMQETPFHFDNVVMSWQANAPAGTQLQFEVKARIGERWTAWYTLGRWSEQTRSSVPEQRDADARVSIDTLDLAAPANAMQYRVIFSTNDPAKSPLLRSIAITYADMTRQAPENPPALAPGWARDLPVPQISQLEQDPAIRNEICSPTSLTMVLNYWGMNQSISDVLNGVFDHSARIWGNWPFNSAYAASLGLDARVARFTSMEQLQNEIAAGRPVVISVRYTRGELDDAYLQSTNGHLLVVRGFTDNGDVIVNDPFNPTAASVRRVYKRDQVANIWLGHGGIAYLVHPRQG